MHHVSKGMTMIHVEDAVGFKIQDDSIKRITTLSPPLFDDSYDYHNETNIENAEDESAMQQGMNI